MDSENAPFIKYFCDKESTKKFARSKVIARINLTVNDLIRKSGDAESLSVNYGKFTPSKDITTNKDIYESFIGSIKKYNGDKEYNQHIDEKKMIKL